MTTASLSRLSLSRVDPKDEHDIRQWHELHCAVQSADRPGDPPPCWVAELAGFRQPWPGEDRTAWLAQVAGSVVGACELNLPTLDNLHNALGDLVVAPEHRRRGIGRTLLNHLRAEATRAGRIRLAVWGVGHPLDPAAPDPARQFTAAVAATAVPALVNTRRRLDIDVVDPAVLSRLDAQAKERAGGYSLVQWVGATPPQWLEGMAYLTQRMSTDIPLDDLSWDEEPYDAARMQARETCCLACGLHMITTAALDSGGQPVAYTQIVGDTTTQWYADQWDTIVAPEHRGHRLGTLIKIANLAYARAQRPELRIIDTSNADSNPHMVAINEAMGFRPYRRLIDWQLDL